MQPRRRFRFFLSRRRHVVTHAAAEATPDGKGGKEGQDGGYMMIRALRVPRRRAGRSASAEPVRSAEAAALRYVSDEGPGIRRVRAGEGFRYVGPDRRPIRDEATLRRIKALAIPPAWREVWICPQPDGHLQATGLDDRNRKQYRYHPRWRTVRDEAKFEKMIAFAQALPGIRRQTRRDLKRPGLPREKVLAAIVQLLEKTLIRVGNDEYARTNRHYGLTTLRDGHATIRGGRIRFAFKGKSGVSRTIDLEDAELARVVKACQELPNQELFAYLDEAGQWVDVTSTDVNAYLKHLTGEDFTAKDFRTWAATVLAARAFQELRVFGNKTAAKKNVVQAVETVARELGNTSAVCRKCYIHPAIIDAYLDGSLVQTLRQRARKMSEKLARLRPEEAAVLAFLSERLKQEGE